MQKIGTFLLESTDFESDPSMTDAAGSMEHKIYTYSVITITVTLITGIVQYVLFTFYLKKKKVL